jgi:PRC-barrel domain
MRGWQPAREDEEASTMTDHQQDANWNVAEWHGKMLVDRDGERIGKLQDVYVDVENDEPQFATVKEGLIGRHLTFVPLGGITVGPDDLQVTVTKEQIKSAPNIEQHGEELSQADESALYHHYELHPAQHRERPPTRPPLTRQRNDTAPRARPSRSPPLHD